MAYQKTLDLTPEEEDEACIHAMQLAGAANFPRVLKTAIELDVLTIMARDGQGGFMTPAEIAEKLSTTNTQAADILDRMLRLLASYKVLYCDLRPLDGGGVQRLYGLAPVCKYLVKNQDGASIAPAVLVNLDKVYSESWYYLKDAVLEGGVPFEKAYGITAFAYHGVDSRFNNMFNKAMSGRSTLTMKKVLEKYKGFEGLKSLVDVGGGTGSSLNMILSIFPSIKAINFDVPHVIADAPAYQGVKHVGGDMFVSVPKGDAIFMKWLLHDWNDEHCLKVLKNCHEALPVDGKVIIVEAILPVYPNSDLSAKYIFQLDNSMLVQNPGGKERTEMEFEALAVEAGFVGFKVVCCAVNHSVMEIFKK